MTTVYGELTGKKIVKIVLTFSRFPFRYLELFFFFSSLYGPFIG